MRKYLIVFLLHIILYSCNNKSDEIFKINQIFQYTLLKPTLIKKVAEQHYFIDFNKDAFGTLVLNLTPTENDTIIIHLGEKLSTPFKIDRNPGGTIRYCNVTLPISPQETEYTIKLPFDTLNTGKYAIKLPDSVGVIMPFRYCEIEKLKTPILYSNIKQKVYYNGFNDSASEFICSDTILKQVWDLCKYSIKATNFCGIYIDGDRERVPYEADALINQLSHYCVDKEYSIAQKTNEYFIEHPTWPTEWILQTVPLFYNDYLYTGNITLIKKYYDILKIKTLSDLEDEDGLISSKSNKLTDALMKKLGFKNEFKEEFKKILGLKNKTNKILDIVDWPETERDGYEMSEVNTVVNSFYYMNLKLMSKIAGYLGEKEDSIFYYTKSINVKNTINTILFNKEKDIYIDGKHSTHSSLHANMFPLAFGLVPPEQIQSIVAFIKTKGMACSPYGAQYLLEGLYNAHEADYAFTLMTALHDRSWWNMIKSGSTITMEAWDMKYKSNADWNHAWSTAPANIVTRFLWGIMPVEPGFNKVQITPQLSNLTFSKIKVPTIKGYIIAEYREKSKKNKEYIIEIPANMKADFILLDKKKSTIFLNKKIIKPIFGIIYLNPGYNIIKIKQ